jgi:hypothetical protein
MKLLLILAATLGCLTMTATTSQAQALVAMPGGESKQATSDPAQQLYFDDYGTMRAYSLIPWYAPSLAVKPGSHVYTSAGEDPLWPVTQHGPKIGKPPWNHDGHIAFLTLVPSVPNPSAVSPDFTYAYKPTDCTQYHKNVKSGKWKEFKNGE